MVLTNHSSADNICSTQPKYHKFLIRKTESNSMTNPTQQTQHE